MSTKKPLYIFHGWITMGFGIGLFGNSRYWIVTEAHNFSVKLGSLNRNYGIIRMHPLSVVVGCYLPMNRGLFLQCRKIGLFRDVGFSCIAAQRAGEVSVLKNLLYPLLFQWRAKRIWMLMSMKVVMGMKKVTKENVNVK